MAHSLSLCRLLCIALVLSPIAKGQTQPSTEPGLTDSSIKLGTIVPSAGPLSEPALAARSAIKAYFAEVNSKGGIHGRKLELVEPPVEGDSLASATRLIKQERVFAIVGGIAAGVEKEIGALALSEGVPIIGPASLNPPSDPPLTRQVFYIMPGLKDQVRALVNFAGITFDPKISVVAIVHSNEFLAELSAMSGKEQMEKLNWKSVNRYPYPDGTLNANQLVSELKQKNTAAVFFFGKGNDLKQLMLQMDQLGYYPFTYSLGVSAGSDWIAAFKNPFTSRINLAFPTIPSDITAAGMAEYRELLNKYKLLPNHPASQVSALAAAKVFVEGLKRAGASPGSSGFVAAGKTLTRQKLIEAIEGLRDFETGFSPRQTFSPTRRTGATGAYMVTFNPDTKQLATVGGWISAN